ncbi:unnamed protein product, partial [Iphiclides podalirius]
MWRGRSGEMVGRHVIEEGERGGWTMWRETAGEAERCRGGRKGRQDDVEGNGRGGGVTSRRRSGEMVGRHVIEEGERGGRTMWRVTAGEAE